MSKCLNKTVKNTAGWTAFFTYVVLVASMIAIIFGVKGIGAFNKSALIDDANTLTVSMNQYAYLTEIDTVEDVCEEVFDGLKVAYQKGGEMTGDESELVYVFDSETSLRRAENALEDKIGELQVEDGALFGTTITVASNSEKTVAYLAKNYVLRGVIAGIVLVAAIYVYAAIRFGIARGIVAAVSTFFGLALTVSVVILTRIPVTASVSYVFAMAALLSAALSMISLNKLAATEKSESAKDMSAEEVIEASTACKAVMPISLLTAGSLVILALVATTAVKWFALVALVAVIAATLVGLIYTPALCLPFMKAAEKKPAKDAYVGAVKTSTKQKKVFQKKEEVKAAPVEAPAEETVEEAVEEVAEEVVEEACEEVTEEAPVEETPAEEVNEAE